MTQVIKFNQLETTAIVSIVLKLLIIVFMVLTMFIPILTMDFTSSNFEAVMTFYSFNIPLKVTQGNSSDVPTHFTISSLNIFFILVILGIIVTLLLCFFDKNLLGGIANTFSIIVLGILFINYFVANSLNGKTMSGIALSVTTELGYYLLILAVLFLFISSFTKIKLKKLAK